MSLMLREPMNSLTYSLMLNEYVAHWDVGSKGIHYKRLLYATLSTLRCLSQITSVINNDPLTVYQ